MNFNYTLRYRPFESLLEDVKQDFKNYALEGKVNPATLLKVAMRVSYDLGLRINVTKEVVLSLDNGKVRLPDDFFVMNYALICGEFTVETIIPQGTNIQEIPYPTYKEVPATVDKCAPITVNCRVCNSIPCGCTTTACPDPNIPDLCPTPVYDPNNPYGNTCIKPRVYLDCKGNSMQLIQVVNTQTRTYKHLYPVRFINSQFVDCDCPNLKFNSLNTAYIKDGFLYSSLKEGNIYINYQGLLEDEEGNLMVVDHPMINEYYEYALKERILENQAFEGENVINQLQIVTPKLRAARNNALTIVNTPNFSEMAKTWALNRKAMYQRYYNMFKPFYFGTVYGNDFTINNAV
jgi:hypothetical protein